MSRDGAPYILYGTLFSLYTGKARAYLRYKGRAYRERLSTLRRYKRIIVPKTGVAFIPVVETPNGEFIQDTTEIIDHIEARGPAPAVYPPTPRRARRLRDRCQRSWTNQSAYERLPTAQRRWTAQLATGRWPWQST